MSDLLLLLLGPSPEAPLRWGVFGETRLIEGGWIESAAELGDLPAPALSAARTVALLPGEQVASRPMPAAPRGAAKLQAAAGYLMEDELGESAEALRIAVAGERTPPLAIAAKAAIVDAWADAFAAAGVECDVLSADYLALPSSAEAAMIVAEGGRVVAAFNGAGASMERDLFVDIGPALIGAPARLTIVGDAGIARLLPNREPDEWLGEANDARLLSIFADAVRASAPPNFRQARMFNRRAMQAAIAPWRRAGLLAAGLACLFVLGSVVDGVRAARIADRWDDAAHALHRQYHPEDATADPVAYARRQLNSGAGGASFLFLSAKFADALEANDAVEIDRIRFNAARGEFVVSMRSQSDSAIEALKETLSGAGVVAEDAGGYRNIGGVWTGELTARAQ